MNEFKKDLNFAIILRNKPINTKLASIIREAYKINLKFFGKKIEKFKIVICDTEDEFKRGAKYYYFKWGRATVLRDCTMVVRSSESIKKIGRWKKSLLKKEKYSNLVNHEMNHVFWTQFYNMNKPVWLCEGLACYVGENLFMNKKCLNKFVKKHKVDYSILHYMYLKRKFKKGLIPMYPVWAGFTRFIIKKYGSQKKLIRLMDEFCKKAVKENYSKIFEKLFNKSEKELFQQFLKE